VRDKEIKGIEEIKEIEAVQFFKKESGLHRLLELLIEKYRGLGRIGGSVKLSNLSAKEREALSLFFRKDFGTKKSVSISFTAFEEALQNTRFANVSVKEILDGFSGQDVLTKTEEEALYQAEKKAFFTELCERFSHPNCKRWLQNLTEKGPGSRGVHLAYDKDRDLLRLQLEHVLSAIQQLPREMGKNNHRNGDRGFERLPVFATRVAKDPHAFDPDTDQGRFLISALQWIWSLEEESFEIISSPSAEQITEVLHHFGIIRDDLLNFVTCTGLQACDKNSQPLSLWQQACKSGNVMNVPLREILKVSSCEPILSRDDTGKVVFVVENSGVFSAIMDYFEDRSERFEGLVPPLICTHGQFKLATLLLLDKLVASDTILYYSGDFDPEGLQMAQRMLERHPGHVRLWRYTDTDYENSLSNVALSDERLRKLESVTAFELISVKQKMISLGRAGYQEDLIADLVGDMVEILHCT
jgi:uncharacterized protein (TIGR02679 family)